MRITTFPVEESEIAFDFSKALTCDKHDETHKVFDGVDFIVAETNQFIWLEVKNFEKGMLAPKFRGGARRKFLAIMKTGKQKKGKYDFFRDELRAKFVGTAATFWLMGIPLTKPIVYVVLLESPRFDSALKLNAISRLRSLIPANGAKSAPWATLVPTNPSTAIVKIAVVDSDDWNALYPDYPATVL